MLCSCAQVHRLPCWRCVEGRFAGSARTRRDGMCLGGAWEVGSGRHGITHFHGGCHTRTWKAGRLEVRTGAKDEKYPGSERRVPASTGSAQFRSSRGTILRERHPRSQAARAVDTLRNLKRMFGNERGVHEGTPRVRIQPFLFAQVPSRAAKSTFWSIIVRSDAPKGPGRNVRDGRRYALPGNVPQRAVWVEVRKRAGGEMCLGGA